MPLLVPLTGKRVIYLALELDRSWTESRGPIRVLPVGRQVLVCIFVALASVASSAGQTSHSLPILVYHQLRVSGNEPPDAPDAISLERFESQMRYLHAQGYTTLSMNDVVRFLKDAPFPAKVVAIHFDDGWKSALQPNGHLLRFNPWRVALQNPWSVCFRSKCSEQVFSAVSNKNERKR